MTRFNDWPEDNVFFRLNNALSGFAPRGIKDCGECDEIYKRLQARFKLRETGASWLPKALNWRAKEDGYKFSDYV